VLDCFGAGGIPPRRAVPLLRGCADRRHTGRLGRLFFRGGCSFAESFSLAPVSRPGLERKAGRGERKRERPPPQRVPRHAMPATRRAGDMRLDERRKCLGCSLCISAPPPRSHRTGRRQRRFFPACAARVVGAPSCTSSYPRQGWGGLMVRGAGRGVHGRTVECTDERLCGTRGLHPRLIPLRFEV